MPIPQVPSPLQSILASSTYNAAWFPGNTIEVQIQNAINAAVIDGASYVFVPKSMYPYNASLVTFNSAIRMIRESGDPSVWDVLAYGATFSQNDSPAFDAAFAGASAFAQYFGTTLAGAPTVVVPTRASPLNSTLSYNLVTSHAVPRGVILTGDGQHAALIRFLPSPTGKVMFYSYGTAEAQGPTAQIKNLFLYNGTAAGENIAIRVRNFDDLTLENVAVSNFKVGVWTDWGQNVSIINCQITLNTRGLQLGGNVTQTETPVPSAGIRAGAFAPNFLDSVRVERTSFAQNQCDINYCGSQYALGGFLVEGCRFFESASSPVAGKFTFIRMSGSQSARITRNEFESPQATRAGVSVANTGLDGDANGPNWGVEIDANMFLFTTGAVDVTPVVIARGTAFIHENTFICAAGGTPAVPITLSDATSPSVVGPNTYLTFVNGAVPTEGFGAPISITGEPNGGHAVLLTGQSPFQETLLNGGGATVTPNAARSMYQKIRVTNNTAFTINNPTNPHVGFDLTLHIENASGGAMGAITFGAEYKLAGAFTNPANGQVRTIRFHREKLDGTGKWREVNRSAADQPV